MSNSSPTQPATKSSPRDAASVIVHRQQNSKKQILLGQRNAKSKFMPNVYVFPGGAVEAADARIKPATNLDPRLTPLLAVAGQTARARTLANAAVRETFEECGVMISQTGLPGNVQQDTWQQFHQLEQAPDLASLKYIGRAITPASSPIRFHARFFSCNLDNFTTEQATETSGDGELNDIHWVDIDAIDDLPMRDITRYMLKEHLLLSEKPEEEQIGNVVYTHRNGQLHIVRQAVVT